MDKIEKFLQQLSKKELRFLMQEIFPKIKTLQLKGLNVRPLTGHKGLYRLRAGKVRIIFFKDKKNKKGVIIAIDHRKNIYRNI